MNKAHFTAPSGEVQLILDDLRISFPHFLMKLKYMVIRKEELKKKKDSFPICNNLEASKRYKKNYEPQEICAVAVKVPASESSDNYNSPASEGIWISKRTVTSTICPFLFFFLFLLKQNYLSL